MAFSVLRQLLGYTPAIMRCVISLLHIILHRVVAGSMPDAVSHSLKAWRANISEERRPRVSFHRAVYSIHDSYI